MRRGLAAAGVLMLGAVAAIAAFAAYDPHFRRDLGQLPGEFSKWSRKTAKSVALSIELAFRSDVIEPERFRYNFWPAEYNLTLFRYVQSDPWITDGASLTFRFPRRYVLTNIVSGSGAVPEVPIIFDADTQRPPECRPNREREVTATVSLPQTYIPAPPRPEDFSDALPLPEGGLPRVRKGSMLFVPKEARKRLEGLCDTVFAIGEEHCGFALYETDDKRLDNLSYPFDRARIFRREAGSSQPARTVVCSVRHARGTCRTIDAYELGMKIDVAFPRAMICEADEVMRRARKIFDDHLIKRTEAVPNWGNRIEK